MGRRAVLIGWVARPHGVRGDLRAKPSGPTLAGLAAGATVTLRSRDGSETERRVAGVSGSGERLILRLQGVSDRDAAEALSGREILVPEGAVPGLDDPDTYYVRDLLGYRVLVGERVVGEVSDVVPGPANDSLEVEASDGPLLVPFTGDAVVSVDRQARVLVLREGLLGS